MSRRRPVRKITRAATGGAVVVMAILAVMFFQGGGLGPGGGSDDRSPEDFEATTDPGDAVLWNRETPPDETSDSASSAGLTDDEKRALSGDTLVILIDEHDYLMQTSAEPDPQYRPVELNRIIELAQMVPGDTNGIRVRIEKRRTARASTEYELRVELEQSGIGRDAIFESSDLVP